MVGGVMSMATTMKNALSDDEAIRKLGWPQNDLQAQQELSDNLNLYAQLKTWSSLDRERFTEFNKRAFRRTDFLHRAFLILSYRPDGIELAKFLLEKHTFVMSPNLQKAFEKYLEE
jgi:hypothetical protein